MQVQCEEILNEWKTMVPTDGTSVLVDVFPYLPDYTGSVVSRSLFSASFQGKIKRTFNIISELTLLAVIQYLPTKKYRRAKEIEKEVHTTFTNMINERLKLRNVGEKLKGEKDLFHVFLDELYEQKIMNRQEHDMVIHEIIQQCKLFFIAGYETTSNLVAWTIIMLARHQDWQARAREEAFQVFGDKNANLNPDNMNQMKTEDVGDSSIHPHIINLSQVTMWASIVSILVLTILFVIAWRFLNWVWIRPKKMERILLKQGLRGNSYKFLFGDAKETSIMYKESYSKPIGIDDDIGPRVMPFISKTINTYGENSFIWVGPRPLVFIMDAELMKIVMNKHSSFQKSFKISNPIFKRLIGGLIRFEGDKWSQNRKKLNPHFHLDKLRETVPIMQEQCEEILNEWKTMVPTDGTSVLVDVFPYLPDYTGSVVSRSLFSTSFQGKIKRTFNIISELTLLANQAQPFSVPGEQYLPTKKYRRAKEIEKEVHTTFTNMINERLKLRNVGEKLKGEKDLFDVFLDELYEQKITNRQEHDMVIHEIIQQCKLFFIAGYETTSNLVAWTIIMLARHQDWQARAREEAFQVFGDKNANLNPDNMNQMKTLTMIVNEVLRLYPPSVEVSRVVEEETSLDQYCLPKGSMVMCPVILLHRNPRIWGKDVLEFKPERFAEGVLKAANGHAAFIPFGWGVRNCIGANLAVWETKVFVTLMLRNFSFDLSPTYAHGPLVSLNMQPQYGAPLLLRRL